MVKSKNGGNKDGIGCYELMNLAMTHPVKYYIVCSLMKIGFYASAKKILGIR